MISRSSPSRSLLAVVPGFLLIVPPFIAYYNTATHVAQMERSRGIASEISPALVVVLLIVFSLVIGVYVQEHLNRVWDSAAMPSEQGQHDDAAAPAAHQLRPRSGEARRSAALVDREPSAGPVDRCTRSPGGSPGCRAYCSRTWAVHPAIRATAKIGVIRSVGMPSTWYTLAA